MRQRDGEPERYDSISFSLKYVPCFFSCLKHPQKVHDHKDSGLYASWEVIIIIIIPLMRKKVNIVVINNLPLDTLYSITKQWAHVYDTGKPPF